MSANNYNPDLRVGDEFFYGCVTTRFRGWHSGFIDAKQDWIAFIKDDPTHWEAGVTQSDAIGRLFITHQDQFNFRR